MLAKYKVIGNISMTIIALTVVGYCLLVDKTAIATWAFSFLLFAEISCSAAAIAIVNIGSQHEKVFANAGSASVIALYFITVVLSMFLAPYFAENINVFIYIELAIIAVAVILQIIILIVSRYVCAMNIETKMKLDAERFNTPKRGGY